MTFRPFVTLSAFATFTPGVAAIVAAFPALTTFAAGWAVALFVARARVAAIASAFAGAAVLLCVLAVRAVVATLPRFWSALAAHWSVAVVGATFVAACARRTVAWASVAAFMACTIFRLAWFAIRRGRWLHGWCDPNRPAGWCGRYTKQTAQPGKKARFRLLWCGAGHGVPVAGGLLVVALCRRSGRCAVIWRRSGGWGGLHAGGGWSAAIGQHALDDRLLPVGALVAAARHGLAFFDFLDQLVAGFHVFQARVVVFKAFQLVVRGIERLVGHHHHVDALLELNLGDLDALLVEQEAGDLHRHLHQNCGSAVLERLFLNDAQNLQRRRFGVADMARTTTARAGYRSAFVQGRAQALAAHFQQAKFADGTKLDAGAVLAQRVAQAAFHLAAVAAFLHVDEIDHNQATQIAQTCLARHLIGGFQVGAQRGFFNVATLDGACRVHIHRHQGFGLIDHNRAAAGQLYGAAVSGLNLMFDLEAAKQRCVVAVTLHAVLVFRHHVRHELVRLLVNVVGVDQNFTDIDIEIIANGANHQARLLVNQECTLASFGGTFNRRPQLEQIVQIPLQFTGFAANASGAGNDAHAIGVFQLFQCRFEFGAILALDAAAHATTARVVGHQHHVTTRQTDVSGQGSALVATLFFFHLHQQFLAFADHVLNACLRWGHIALEILA